MFKEPTGPIEKKEQISNFEFIDWGDEKNRGFLFENKDKYNRSGYVIISSRNDPKQEYNPKWVWGFNGGSYNLTIPELKKLFIEAQSKMPEALPLIEDKINFLNTEGKEQYEKELKIRETIDLLEIPKKKEMSGLDISEFEYSLLRCKVKDIFGTDYDDIGRHRNEQGQLTNPQTYGIGYKNGVKLMETRTHHGSSYFANIPIEWKEKLEEIKKKE